MSDPRCLLCWSGPCPEHDEPAEVTGQGDLLDLIEAET